MKKLSIITVCYNEPNLKRTCESIVNQTWQDFEWIVVDGGSNQETQDIWNKYKYRIDTFISEKDKGIYDAMNKGIKIASGEYLIFMNAGDGFYSIDLLENIFKDKEYNSGVLYGNCALFSEKNKKEGICRFPKKLTKKDFILGPINHQSAFIKRELFEKYGYYNLQYKIASDYDGFLRFFTNGEEFRYIDLFIAHYDNVGISSTAKEKTRKELHDIVRQYYSEDEVVSTFEKYGDEKVKYSLQEWLFSLKNDYSKKYKILTILGVKIKFKRRKKVIR